MGILLLSIFLRRRGWHVVYLGQAVPLEDLPKSLPMLNADVLVLAATVSTRLKRCAGSSRGSIGFRRPNGPPLPLAARPSTIDLTGRRSARHFSGRNHSVRHRYDRAADERTKSNE